MQRPKFDLSRLRDRPMQVLRDRTARVRQIQALGTQVAQLRKRRFRAEYLVPAAALLLLILALILSYGTSGPLSVDRGRPTAAGGSTGANATATSGSLAGTSRTGYPGTAVLPTSGAIAIKPVTTGTPLAGTSGYPGPSMPNGPIPGSTLVAGGAIPGNPPISTPLGSVPTPAFATPALPGSTGSFVSPPTPRATGNGYPAPTTGNVSGPNPGAVQGPALIPTAAPFVVPSAPFVPPAPQSFATPSRPRPAAPAEPLPTAAPAYRPPASGSSGSNPGSGYPPPSTGSGVTTPPSPTALPPVVVGAPAAPAAGTPGTAGPTSTPTVSGPPKPSATPNGPPTPRPPTATRVPPTPTPKPVVAIQGNVRWTTAQSPVFVQYDILVTPGATLQIDPGVEVRMQPGVNIFVQGQLAAIGAPSAPVRFIGPNGRWNSLAGQTGSTIRLEHVQLRNAGQGGVAVSSSGGSVNFRDVLLTDGGGGIATNGAAVDIQGSQVIGNDLPQGPALLAGLGPTTPLTLRGNIIGGNQTPVGTPQVRLIAGNTGAGPIDIEGNGFASAAGALLDVQTASALGGTIRCNGFRTGTVGLQLSASTPSADGFNLVVDTNAFEQQTLYGAASTVSLAASNNWWGDPSGPYDAQRNPAGRGVRVGVNVSFAPPLQARPDCAPVP